MTHCHIFYYRKGCQVANYVCFYFVFMEGCASHNFLGTSNDIIKQRHLGVRVTSMSYIVKLMLVTLRCRWGTPTDGSAAMVAHASTSVIHDAQQ